MQSSRIFSWLCCFFLTLPVFGQHLPGTWTHLSPEYEGITWPACWLDIEAKGDHLYILYSDYEILYLVHSPDLGDTWETEVVEDLREWPRELEVHKIPTNSASDTEVMQQWAKEGHMRVSSWKTTMEVDAEGGVHIAYILSYDNIYCSSQARYAYRSPIGKWKSTVIQKIEDGWLSNEIDMEVDNGGTIHLAYLENNRLLYVTSGDGEAWKMNEVFVSPVEHQGNGSMGGVNIGVDSKHGIHIGYQAIERPFFYAYSDNDGKTWSTHPIDPQVPGKIWFEAGMGLDRFDRPHVIMRVLHDHLLHAVFDDNEWRFTRATPDPGNRGEPFFDEGDGMYMAYYPSYISMTQTPLRLASTQNYGFNWMHETITMDAAGICSGAYGDCAAANDRLYVVYHRNDTALGLAWKPLKEVGVQDSTVKNPAFPVERPQPEIKWEY